MKNLDVDVVARLTEQAEAEGMSLQEWIRRFRSCTADLTVESLARPVPSHRGVFGWGGS